MSEEIIEKKEEVETPQMEITVKLDEEQIKEVVEEATENYDDSRFEVIAEQFKRLTTLYEDKQVEAMGLQQRIDVLVSEIDTLTTKKLEEPIKIWSYVTEKNEAGEIEEKRVEFEVQYRPPSSHIRIKFLELEMKQREETISNYNDTAGGKGIEGKYLKDLTDDEIIIADRVKIKNTKTSFDFLLSLFKLIVDDKQCVTEQKGYLRSPIDSEFYQNLDETEVQKAVISFRIQYKI